MAPHWLAESSGRGDPIRAASFPDPVSVASWDSVSLLFTALLFLAFRDIGSRDIKRGLGGPSGPMSTVSTREIFVSQLEAAVMDVGRVIVAVIT